MRILPVILLSLLSCISYAQGAQSKKKVKRWPIWFTPSKADVINGITISPLESFYFFKKKPQQLNGLVIHAVGTMLLGPLIPGDPNVRIVKDNPELSEEELVSAKLREDTTITSGASCNGVLISVSGTITKTFNGVNISPFCARNIFSNGFFLNAFYNFNHHLKGVAVAALYNSSFEVRGVQIGLFNYTHKLEGMQIGLWNVHKNRKLPIINWGFKRKNKTKES